MLKKKVDDVKSFKKDVKRNLNNDVKSMYSIWQNKNRAEVLKMLSEDYKIPQIASLKNCSPTAIYRLRKRMIKDGLINDENELSDKGLNIVKKYMVLSDDVKFNMLNNIKKRDMIDLNKVHVTVRILDKPKRYDYRQNNLIAMKVRDYKITDLKNNYKEEFVVNNVKIKTNIDSIEIFPERILADTESEATQKLMNIIFEVIPKIENLHNIKLIKENYCNIRISENHWELVRNEMAKIYKIEDKDDVFRVFDDYDGKVRLVVDFSHKTPNFEAEHYSKAHNDIKIMKPYFDELGNKGRDYFLQLNPREREKFIKETVDDKNFYYPTENAKVLNEILQQQKVLHNVVNEIGHGQKFILDFLKSQLPQPNIKEKSLKMEVPSYVG